MGLANAIWLSVCLTKVVALIATLRPGRRKQLTCVRLFLIVSLMAEASIWFGRHFYGIHSAQYKYTYFGSDFVVVLAGFFTLVRLVELSFENTSIKVPRIRAGAMLLFSGVATCSVYILYLHHTEFKFTHLSIELGQNFSFLGMVLTVLLWMSMNILRVPGVRLRRVVLCFAMMYSAGAIAYALEALLPQMPGLATVMQLTPLAAIALLAFALFRPEPDTLPVAKEALPLRPVLVPQLPQSAHHHKKTATAAGGAA